MAPRRESDGDRSEGVFAECEVISKGWDGEGGATEEEAGSQGRRRGHRGGGGATEEEAEPQPLHLVCGAAATEGIIHYGVCQILIARGILEL